jgi:peptidoglycan/LPS O-acetylase OafA/YrhL
MSVEATSETGMRIRELDALRGLAAMAVVLFHYTTRFDELYGHKSRLWFDVPWGHFGVQLFFSISGFVIFMTLDRTRSLRDFAVSRASRLYPAYWAAILLTTTTVALSAMEEITRSPLEIAVNATMVQSFVNVPSVDGVYWTLSVELVFYCAMAALWKLRLLGSIEPVLLAWMSLKWVWRFAPSIFGIEPSWLLGVLFIQDCVPFFAIGIVAYRFRCRTADRRWIGVVIGAAIVTVAACDDFAHLVVALISTTVLGAIAMRPQALLVWRPLVWLGTVSYSMYLLHQFIGFAMLRWLETANLPTTAAIALTTGAMLALAGAVTFLVERPALRAIRKWYRPHQSRTPSPSELLAG